MVLGSWSSRSQEHSPTSHTTAERSQKESQNHHQTATKPPANRKTHQKKKKKGKTTTTREANRQLKVAMDTRATRETREQEDRRIGTMIAHMYMTRKLERGIGIVQMDMTCQTLNFLNPANNGGTTLT